LIAQDEQVVSAAAHSNVFVGRCGDHPVDPRPAWDSFLSASRSTSASPGAWLVIAALLLLRAGSSDAAVVAAAGGVVRGIVVSARQELPLAGVVIRLRPGSHGTDTDSLGRFKFSRLAPGEYRLSVAAMGYHGWEQAITVVADSTITLTCLLEPAPIQLGEVVVSPSRSTLLGPETSDWRALGRERIARMPHLGDDLFRAAAGLPGASGGDISAGLHLRGGEIRETSVRLDGIEVAEPLHFEDLQGIFSAIDPDAIGSATVYTGGFPASFGGHASGVMDLQTDPGPAQPRVILGLSVLAARVLYEGSSKDDRQDVMFSARRGYLDLVMPIVDPTTPFRPRYGDAFLRWRYHVGPKTCWSVRLRGSTDAIDFEGTDTDERLDARQRALQGWITLESSPLDHLTATTTTAISHAHRSRVGGFFGSDAEATVDDLRDFDRVELDQRWKWQSEKGPGFEGGIELGWDRSAYRYGSLRIFRDPLVTGGGPPQADTVASAPRLAASEQGAYLSARAQPTRGLLGEAGVRWSHQGSTGDQQWDPRLQARWSMHPVTWRAAWGIYHQPQRLDELQVEDGVDTLAGAERAEHRILGLDVALGHGFHLGVQGYDRRLTALPARYENLFDPIQLIPEAEPDRVRIAPDAAQAKGVEITVEQTHAARLNGWASLVLSSARDQIDGLWVARAWDQRNALTWNVEVPLTPRWDLAVSGVAHGGWPTTRVLADTVHEANGTTGIRPKLGPLRGARFPSYRRVDVRLSRRWEPRSGRVTFYVEVMNVLNRKNPCCVDNLNFAPRPDGTVEVIPRYDYWLPILPSFGITWEIMPPAAP
jgi:CarboxypepD_reg-like domain/TonB dependent receptor-like, beta-barrel/TonB-dependent Receptor Plug Domain